MWLLSTDRAELHYFVDPEAVPGGYAILSHVWDEHEQLFKETQKLKKRCDLNGTNPRDLSSEKVRQICIIAEKDGIHWLWDDTCCIDKSSSAELSEGINSMYRYYSLAEVCYAYLADVPSAGFPGDKNGPFATSKWHTRGWTLQELIAPARVEFISSDWNKLGSKTDNATFLSDITHIPVEVLLMEKPAHSFSVARRMCWASERETSRVEDRAYSLLGLFAVNMTPMYGEGERAFRRLQEEVMRQTPDPSLFAWGNQVELRETDVTGQDLHRSDSSTPLLADSPDNFDSSVSGSLTFSQEISSDVFERYVIILECL